MRLFGRRDPEDDYEDDDENPRRKTFPKKELRKELSEKEKFFKGESASRRKKKFEITPWTKKERLIVLGVFVATMAASGVLGMSAREWKLPNLPRLTFPKILSEETIVIEGSGSSKVSREVEDKFDSLIKPLSGVYGFFVINMSDGSTFGINENETFEAGSLNKLPVMVAMYKEAELGNINLSTKYVLKEADKVPGAGSLASKPAGFQITYQDLVKAMGHESDNTAFNISRKLLGDEKILEVMKEASLPESLLSSNEVAPKDIGYFWKQLLDLKISSRETRDALIGYLTGTIYENLIAKDIPVQVAHKVGLLPHVRNDAGVVMSGKPYILVVMSKGVIEKEADEVIPVFAKELYSLMSQK